MNLYLISKSANNDWDTYDAAVVCAVDEADAKTIHPSDDTEVPAGGNNRDKNYGTWTSQDNVTVEYLGVAAESVKRGVVLASFNAG